jgi:hypothetical protein
LDHIRAGQGKLVNLCGNAGNAKPAVVQHLVRRLGVEDIQSSRRVWQTDVDDGRRLMANLYSAVAWRRLFDAETGP